MKQAASPLRQDARVPLFRRIPRTVVPWCLGGLLIVGLLTAAGLSQVRMQFQIQIRGPGIGGPDFGSAPVNEWSDQMGRLLREGQGEPAYSKKSQRKLEQAEEAIKKGDHAGAVTRLQEIIDAGEDAFREPAEPAGGPGPGGDQPLPNKTPAPPVPVPAGEDSIRRTADQILETLPDAARNVYETQYGPIARELAEQAREGSESARRELLRRFRQTVAGQEFAFRDALNQFDRGDFAASARAFERLLLSRSAVARFGEMLVLRLAAARYAAGDLAGAARALETGLTRKLDLDVGGRRVTYDPESPRGEAWLRDLFGELPLRNAVALRTSGAGPHPGRVNRSPAITPYLAISGWMASPLAPILGTEAERQLEERLTDYSTQTTQIAVGQAMPLIPASQAVVVGDAVVFPGVAGPLAVDLMTGRLKWSAAEWGSLLPRLRSAFEPQRGQSNWPSELQDRCWLDQTVGSLSADGDRVYAIGRHQVPPSPTIPAMAFVNSGAIARDYCSLSALDARTGKLIWRIDPFALPAEDPLLEVTFLGAPLALEGQLYLLGEVTDRISLFVLDATTGRLEWSQPLTRLRQAAANGGGVHRRRGLSPSFGRGVLVCPTDAGFIVGIDPVERTLLWRRDYDVVSGTSFINHNRAIVQPTSFPDGLRYYVDQLGWTDNNALVDGDLTFVSPRSGGRLVALETHTGMVRWVATPEGGLFIGGVTDSNLIVVTRNGVLGLRRDTGKPAWKEPLLRAGAASGRGVLAGKTYLLPTVHGELVSIDTDAGTVLRRDLPASGKPLGNLAAARGTILSLRPEGMTAYHDLAVLEAQIAVALERDPADLRARRVRAGLLVARGELEAGVAAYRDLVPQSPGDESLREAFVTALMDLARTRFPDNEPILKELETHLRSEAEKVRYYRMVADLHASRRNADKALDALLAIVDLQFATRNLEPAGESWSARPDRIIAGKTTDLFASLSPDDRRRLAERIERRVGVDASAKRRPGTEDLRRHLSMFSQVSDTAEVRLQLAAMMQQQGEWQDAVHLLLGVVESDASDTHRARAVTDLFALLVGEIGRGRDAWRLLHDFAYDENSLSDAKRKEMQALLEEMRADDPGGEDSPPLRWPLGVPTVTRKVAVGDAAIPGNVPVPSYRPMAPVSIPLSVDGGTWYDDLSLQMVPLNKRLSAFTPTGQEVWSIFLGSVERLEDERKLFARGHLVVLWDGASLAAVDVAGTAVVPRPRVRWQRNLLAEVLSLGTPEPLMNQIANGLPARTDREGRQYFAFGGGDLEVFVYRMGTRLVCVDALRGDPLWQREGVPAGTSIVVAGNRVLLYGPSPKMTRMYRTLDGAEQTPPRDDWSGFLFRQGPLAVVVDSRAAEEGQPARRVVSAIHLETGDTAWNRPISKRALVQSLRGRDVAILEPQGQYTVVSGSSGETLREADLAFDFPATKAFVWPHSERDILFVERGDASELPLGTLLPAIQRRRLFRMNGKVFGVLHQPAERNRPGTDDPAALTEVSGTRQTTTTWSIDCPGYVTSLETPVDLPLLFQTEEVKPEKTAPGNSTPGNTTPAGRVRLIPVDLRTGDEVATETDMDVTTTPDSVEASLQQRSVTVRVRGLQFQFQYPKAETPPAAAP